MGARGESRAKAIGIIGGGPAGLALADDLSQAGFAVTLFEAAPELGGLARSFALGDIRIERYYHFLCSGDTGYFRKLDELGLRPTLEWRPTRMGFFYRGRLYPFSSAGDLLRFDGISLLGRLRYGRLALQCSLTERWQPLDAIPAEGWLKEILGEEAYRATWYPLLRVKFDRFHDRISAAWVWHRVHRVARSRQSPFHQERLGYLAGGTDSLVAALEGRLRACGAELYTGRAARRILIESGRATGVETADGTRWPFDAVVSAVPLPHFVRLAPDLPADYRAALATIDFIGVICVVLHLRHPLSPNFWLNVNDERVPFNGCIEYTNLNPGITEDGSAIVYVPFYLPRDHERFTYDDARLIADCIRALGVINPRFQPDWVLNSVVSRDPYAQVICATGFAARVPSHLTPVENLFLIDSSQLYPADRTISGTIDLAREVATLLGAGLPAGTAAREPG
ncbi:MAG TPA: NAD(P)/FAD-dependent oxidoreductase [Thermoanaerobaculia bacterium]|jgi:protoporphyrinogen oxidase|nr:NAD(P)/FAD-dependent oxidoreductase [Thermoanaerobaculia bacterium]